MDQLLEMLLSTDKEVYVIIVIHNQYKVHFIIKEILLYWIG